MWRWFVCTRFAFHLLSPTLSPFLVCPPHFPSTSETITAPGRHLTSLTASQQPNHQQHVFFLMDIPYSYSTIIAFILPPYIYLIVLLCRCRKCMYTKKPSSRPYIRYLPARLTAFRLGLPASQPTALSAKASFGAWRGRVRSAPSAGSSATRNAKTYSMRIVYSVSLSDVVRTYL